MLTTTALPRGVYPFYRAIGQYDATRASECVRRLTFTSDVAGALLPTAQALYDHSDDEGLELLSSLLVLEAGDNPRDLFADQVQRLDKNALTKIRTIIMGGHGNVQRARRLLAHEKLLKEIRLALQGNRKSWRKPSATTPSTVEAPEALQFFYSALWMGNGPMAAAFLDNVKFTRKAIEMLFPVAQAYFRVNGWNAMELFRGMFTLEGTGEMRASLEYSVGNAARQDLRSAAQIIDRVGGNPNTQALFRTRPAYLAAVRQALASGKASQITQAQSGNGDRFTDEDWTFMRNMDIAEGEWTRDSLLALTTHVSAVKWSAKNNLQKFYRTLADLCRQSRDHVIKQKNGVNKGNIEKIEEDLAKLGLSLGMSIGQPEARTLALYALHRAGIEPGDEILLNSNVATILRGMPLTAADVGKVNELIPDTPKSKWIQHRTIATLKALIEALPEVAHELDEEILERTIQTLNLMGFDDLSAQILNNDPSEEEEEPNSCALF